MTFIINYKKYLSFFIKYKIILLKIIVIRKTPNTLKFSLLFSC